MRQSSILDHLLSRTRPKQCRSNVVSDVLISRSAAEKCKEPYREPGMNTGFETEPASLPVPFREVVDSGSNWVAETFWLFIVEEFSKRCLVCLAGSPRLSCSCYDRVWDASMFSDSCSINRDGCGCYFSLDA